MPSPFPPTFQWGVATAAYQIEGAVAEDGRGPSVWDTFSHTPGRVANGDTGDVACDHYHRFPEDLDLLTDLGVGAYRFSVAWPRIQPTGDGPANAAGLDWYDRLVDNLLERNIDPLVTLFHWDLPQALEDQGGWVNRDTAARFGEYAGIVAERLGDRVKLWLTLNEPFIVMSLGHVLGIHAPGHTRAGDPFPIVHHLLLGHGLATAAIRRHSTAPVGLANAYAPAWAVGPDGRRETATEDDHVAAVVFDAVLNRLFTDPILLGQYPPGHELLSAGPVEGIVLDGDLDVISAPIDALGVNYYFPNGARAPTPDEPYGFTAATVAGYERTGFDWPIVPEAFQEILISLKDRYPNLPPIWITENGCAYPAGVADAKRIEFLTAHLDALAGAMKAGVDVRGYCLWTLLDNFEWAEGFGQRFGLVEVDFETLRRTPRDSFRWYRDLIRS